MTVIVLLGRTYHVPDVVDILPCLSFSDEFQRAARAIHKAFLAPLSSPAFPTPRRAHPREKEEIREPCQLVKERLDPCTGALGARLRPINVNRKNAGKSTGSAFDAEPVATRRDP